MRKHKISAFIPAQDVERIIEDCLKSITWVDEIFIVDGFSTDNTIEICKRYPNVKIVQHEYENSGAQRMWGMPQVKHDWIFVIDSDEICTPELQNRIEEILSSDPPQFNGYRVRIKSKLLGKIQNHDHYLGWSGMRLFKKEMIDNYKLKRVHSKMYIDPEGRITGEGAYIIHEPIRDFTGAIKKMIRYAEWAAQDMFEKGKRARWYHFTIRPLHKFFVLYIIRFGFLDGIRGLILCTMASFSVFLKYYKLFFLQMKTES